VQARIEIGLLKYLSAQVDCDPTTPIVRMKDFFLFKGHLCLVFELLSVNLYELIRKNQFRGLSLNLLRIILEQVLLPLVPVRGPFSIFWVL
jgi:dual specificity protein kinase YAK1